MMFDGGVVFIAMLIVIVIAFIKGAMYASKDKDSSFRSKYSDEDIRKFEDMLRDLQKSKK